MRQPYISEEIFPWEPLGTKEGPRRRWLDGFSKRYSRGGSEPPCIWGGNRIDAQEAQDEARLGATYKERSEENKPPDHIHNTEESGEFL